MAQRQLVFVCLLVGLALPKFARGISGTGSSIKYWSHCSVIYAQVTDVRHAQRADDRIVFRPLGTLTGKLDPGRVCQMSSEMNLTYRFSAEPGKDGWPAKGDRVLLALTDEFGGRRCYGPAFGTGYMPGILHQPLRILAGSRDEDLDKALREVQTARSNESNPRNTAADGISISQSLLVCATVTQVTPNLESYDGKFVPVMNVRPIRTLTGSLDGLDANGIIVQLWNRERFKDWWPHFKSPAVGSTVIVLLFKARLLHPYFLLDKPTEIMPGDGSPVCEIKDVNDPKVAEAIAGLKTARFWETHSVVYGECLSTSETTGDTARLTMRFRPRMTVSGPFDCGRVPEALLFSSIQPQSVVFRPHGLVGSNVLVLVNQTDHGNRITLEAADFMPADHAPICVVKDFDDPRVLETLKFIQKQRHAMSVDPWSAQVIK